MSASLTSLCLIHDQPDCKICEEIERRFKIGGVVEIEKFLKLDIETFLDSSVHQHSNSESILKQQLEDCVSEVTNIAMENVNPSVKYMNDFDYTDWENADPTLSYQISELTNRVHNLESSKIIPNCKPKYLAATIKSLICCFLNVCKELEEKNKIDLNLQKILSRQANLLCKLIDSFI